MKKVSKILMTFIVLLIIPAILSLGVMTLWNSLLTTVCGFAAITFWQAIGIFILGQLLSGGFIIAWFIGFWSIHAIAHPRGDLRAHWHNMTDEERRDFILRRREHFGFRNRSHNGENEAE